MLLDELVRMAEAGSRTVCGNARMIGKTPTGKKQACIAEPCPGKSNKHCRKWIKHGLMGEKTAKDGRTLALGQAADENGYQAEALDHLVEEVGHQRQVRNVASPPRQSAELGYIVQTNLVAGS